MSALQLRPDALFRPTDWRWEKARVMRENRRVATLLGSADDYTRKARYFQDAYDRCEDDYDQLLLIKRWPDLWAAHCLRYRNDEKRLLRFEVEARLLALDPFERIAERTGLSPAAVIWYEKVFFNVLDKLPNKAWVGHCVLGESAQAGLTERDYDILWKLFGYCGGGVVLDAVIDRAFDVTRPDSAGDMKGWLSDDIERVATVKMAVAMRTMPINAYTQEKIAEIYQRFLELRKMADGGGGGDMLTSNLQAMIGSIGWTVGDSRVMVAPDDPKRIIGMLRGEVLQADSYSAELRADDLMQLNTGQRPARLLALSEVRFPEKTDADAKQGS